MKVDSFFVRKRTMVGLVKGAALAGTLLLAVSVAVRLSERHSVSEEELHGLLKRGPVTAARLVGLPWSGETFAPTPSERAVLRRLTKRALAAATEGTAEERRLAAVLLAASGNLEGAAQLLADEDGTAGDPASRSDYGAYLLELGVRRQRPEFLLESLEIAAELGERQPLLREAAFNRASALEGLGLRRAAKEAWLQAARDEVDPGWREELRRRQTALLRDSPGEKVRELGARWKSPLDDGVLAEVAGLLPGEASEVRRIGIENVLHAWSRGVLSADRGGASAALDDLVRLGELLRKEAGDDCLAETASSMATFGSDAGRSRRLAGDLGALLEALANQASGRRQSALSHLSAMRADAWAELPCLAAWVKSREVSLRALAGDARNAVSVGRRALETTDKGVSAGVRAELEVALAVALSIDGNSWETLDHLTAALSAASASRDLALEAWIRALRSGTFAEMGRDPEAGSDLVSAARDAKYLARPGREFLLIDALLHYVVEPAWPGALAPAQFELVEIARERGDPASLSHAHLLAGESRWREAEARLADLDAAAAAAELVEDSFERRRRLLLVSLAASKVLAPRDPALAARRASQAIDLVRTTGMEAYRPQAMLALARAFRASADPHSAERVLKEAREATLKLQSSGRTAEERSLLATSFREIQNETVALRLEDLHDTWGALSEAESTRLPWLASPPESSRLRSAPESIQSRLSSGSAVLVLFQRQEGIDVWWFTSQQAGYSWVPRTRVEVGRSLAAEEEASLGKGGRVELPPEVLARELLAPLSSEARSLSHLVVVPDADLIALPFSEMPQEGADSSWGEASEIVFSPSLGSFLEARVPAPAARGERVAILANGAGSADGAGALARAEQEARSVAGFYPGAHLLLGGAATFDGLKQLGALDLLHIAAHGRVSESPEETALLLSPDRELPDGAWTVRSIAGLGSLAPRVVVLSSCLSAYGARTGGRGSLSLASAFLAAGSETVVASIRPVDDRATAEFMTAFHRELARGSTPAAALRRARGEFAKQGTPGKAGPASSFVVISAR